MDSGLDETSCFFLDEDGLQVEHGTFFDGIEGVADTMKDFNVELLPTAGPFPYDLQRRKVNSTTHTQKHCEPVHIFLDCPTKRVGTLFFSSQPTVFDHCVSIKGIRAPRVVTIRRTGYRFC